MMACQKNFDAARRPPVDRRFCSAAGAALHFSVAQPYVAVTCRFRPWLGSMCHPSGVVSRSVTLAGATSTADRQLRTLCSGKAAAWGAAVGGWLLSSVAGGHRSRLFVAEGGRVSPCATRAREIGRYEALPPAPRPQPQNGLHQARQRRGRLGGGGGGGGLPGLLRPARLRGPDTLRARGGPVRREQPPPPLPMPKTPSFVFAPVAACPRPANTGLGVV